MISTIRQRFAPISNRQGRYVAVDPNLKALWKILTEDVCVNCMEG
jgi:hypothetical protein